MQLKTFFLIVSASFLMSGVASAQSASTGGDVQDYGIISTSIDDNGGQDWTFYLDAEKRLYYIDFESINVNLNDIKVKNSKGQVVLSDGVAELPVNTIYELDMKNMKPGKYQIELSSFTGVIRKEVVVGAD
jgi:uncharacterized protein DUF3244